MSLIQIEEVIKQTMTDFSSILDFIADNLVKIFAIALAPLFQKVVLKLIDKVKFLITRRNFKVYSEKIERIEKICDELMYTYNASRVIYITVHNGDVTFSNLHLCKLTCIVESLSNGIASVKSKISNSVFANVYSRIKEFEEIGVVEFRVSSYDDQDDSSLFFEENGVKNAFSVLVSHKDLPLGILRIEYCDRELTDDSFKVTLKDMLTKKSKMISRLLKP